MFKGFPKRAFPDRTYPVVRIGNVGSITDNDAHLFAINAGITDEVEKQAIYYLVISLKQAGIWPKMRAIYPMVGSTAVSCSYNLVNPARFRITWINSPTFAVTGVLGNGVNQYGNTGFIPSAQLSASNLSFSYYSRNSGSGVGIGAFNVGAGTYMFTQSGGNLFNGGATAVFSGAPSNTGLFFSTKGSANVNRAFHNGVLRQAGTALAGAASVANIAILAFLNVNTPQSFCNQECAFAHIGEHLTDEEAATFYSIVQQFQTILGRQV